MKNLLLSNKNGQNAKKAQGTTSNKISYCEFGHRQILVKMQMPKWFDIVFNELFNVYLWARIVNTKHKIIFYYVSIFYHSMILEMLLATSYNFNNMTCSISVALNTIIITSMELVSSWTWWVSMYYFPLKTMHGFNLFLLFSACHCLILNHSSVV